MRVLTALLADYALAHPDGKLYITGGALHVIRVPTVPYTHPRLALAGSLAFEPNECDVRHSITIESESPSGDPFIKPATIWMLPRRTDDPAIPAVIPFVYSIEDVLLTRAGRFTVTLRWEVGEHVLPPLYVVEDAASLGAWVIPNAAGYDAFFRGDLEAARAHFAETVETGSSGGVGHNNLGYVLMLLGDGPEALVHFEEARRDGFGQTELLEANVACAQYLVGAYGEALDAFSRCYREGKMTNASYLLEIAGDRMLSRSLKSSSDYSRLMAVNAAWSAWRAGSEVSSRGWLVVAAEIEESLGGLEDSSIPALRLKLLASPPG